MWLEGVGCCRTVLELPQNLLEGRHTTTKQDDRQQPSHQYPLEEGTLSQSERVMTPSVRMG